MQKNKNLTQLQEIIGYNFKDIKVLELALTHSSIGGSGVGSYERLEFLGDRVLNLVVATMLFDKFKEYNDGELAKRQSSLVAKRSLIEVGKKINIRDFIILSKSEERNGGRDNKSIQADVIEAIIAAMYVDSGYEINAPREFIRKHWTTLIESGVGAEADFKTKLQEYVQSFGLSAPVYKIIKKTGPDHKPEITVEVSVQGLPEEVNKITATTGSRKTAEVKAAEKMLEILQKTELKK